MVCVLSDNIKDACHAIVLTLHGVVMQSVSCSTC